MRVLLAASGSIGAKDVPRIVDGLKEFAEVKLVVTKHARPFFEDRGPASCEVYDDESDWYMWRKRGDTVLHIELRNWADLYLVAPLTANTLSKFATGRCDDLVSTVFRAWKLKEKPVLVAPSMNLHMWENPITEVQLDLLKSWGIGIIEPRSKLLAGGDTGKAALPTPETLVQHARDALAKFHAQQAAPGEPR